MINTLQSNTLMLVQNITSHNMQIFIVCRPQHQRLSPGSQSTNHLPCHKSDKSTSVYQPSLSDMSCLMACLISPSQTSLVQPKKGKEMCFDQINPLLSTSSTNKSSAKKKLRYPYFVENLASIN